MTTERNNLLVSIATTTADYREGELETPTPEHVDRWINQFDPSVQMPMLRELEHVLKKTYLSKKHMAAFLGKLARWEDAPVDAMVYVIAVADHMLGKWYIDSSLETAIKESGKTMQVKYLPQITIENCKYYSRDAKALWPTNLPDNNELNAHLELPH